MRHYVSENVRQTDVPISVQFRRPIIKDIAVTSRTLSRQEGHPEDLVRRAPGLRQNAQSKVGWPFEPGTVQGFHNGLRRCGCPHPSRQAKPSLVGFGTWRASLARRPDEGVRAYVFPRG